MRTRVESRRLAVSLALVVALAPGCSWVAVHAPPRPAQPEAPLDCTESRAAPAADTALAVLSGIGAGLGLLVAATEKSCSDSGAWGSLFCMTSSERTALVGTSVALLAAGVVFGFSAASGYRDTAACRADVRERRCADGDATACDATGPLFQRSVPSPPHRRPAVVGPPCSSDRDCAGYGGGTCVAGECQP